jgi:hypothetical protein
MARKKITCNTTLCLLLLLLLIRECRQKVAGEGADPPHPPKLMNRRPRAERGLCHRTTAGHPTRHPLKNPTHKSWLKSRVFAQSPQGSDRVGARGVLRSVVVVFSVWFC